MLFNDQGRSKWGPKGNEWAAYDTWYMAQTTNLAWGALVAGVAALGGMRRPMSGRTLALLLCAGLMTAAFFKARRFVEYFPVFTIVFAASAIHDFVADPESWWKDLKAFLGRWLMPAQLALVLTMLGFAGFANWQASREAHGNAWPWRLAGAAKWLEENTPEASQVYNAQWDVFPELIFHNHHNSWTLGLDPNFTYFLDPRLYRISDRLGAGQVPEPGRFVKEHFGCDYAVANKNSGFANTAKFANSGLVKVFEDDHALVYRVEPSDAVRTVEGELAVVEVLSEGAKCEWTEPKGSMGSASARGLYLCTVDGASQLGLRYPVTDQPAGTWDVEARFMTGPSPASAVVKVNGEVVGDSVSLKAPKTRLGRLHRLGQVNLASGSPEIVVEFSGSSASTHHVFGLDYVRLRKKN